MSTADRATLLSSTPAAEGAETMKFYLTYEGRLLATQGDARPEQKDRRAQYKHELRRAWHAQLKEFWQTNRFLKDADAWRSDHDHRANASENREPLSDIIADCHVQDGFRFIPLVRRDWSLHCALDVLILRRDPVDDEGITAGDLDNRLKTIIDGLRMPKGVNEVENIAPAPDENPFYCLLESDSLISEFHVRSGRLLEPKSDESKDQAWVKAIIEVEITPYHGTVFNSMFDYA